MTLSATVRDALGAATDALEAAGCETPRLDAEVMLADALGVDRSVVVSEPAREIPSPASRLMMERVRRRVAREPVAYIVGTKPFRHIELVVDTRVLVPRPETELLVEVALGLPEGARVHDVGTGSGAVALALKQERPDLRVSASDVSEACVSVAQANATRLDLDIELSVARGLPPGDYQLVLANLPYIREDEWQRLLPEVRSYEPRTALVAGADGLDAIRDLVAQAAAGTPLAVEHAPAQAETVRELLVDAYSERDLAGHERVTVGRAP